MRRIWKSVLVFVSYIVTILIFLFIVYNTTYHIKSILSDTPTEPTKIEIMQTEPPTEPPTEPTKIETKPTESPTKPTEIATEPQPQVWWTEEELDMLAALIYYEAGSDDCTDRHQQLVGQVVINRINSDEYPDTIYGVITDTKYGTQYSTCNDVLNNIGNRDIITQRCYDNALMVLNGNVDCPSDIIWQAEFIQGEIYETYETRYGMTYFCYR